MSDQLTDRNFWESFWKSKNNLIFNVPKDYVFGNLLAKAVEKSNAKSAIELGGFPGYYSVYFRKHLKVDTTLFDYFISKNIINQLLQANGLEENDIHVIEADLFNYTPQHFYDIVSSFGLIEHFTDSKDIIKHHLKFLKPGGILFITLPNFKSVNGWIQKNFDKDNYDKHNIDCMNPDMLSAVARQVGLKNIKVGYYGKFTVWLENKDQTSALTKAFVKLIWLTGKLVTKIFPFESKALSPYIVLEATKPNTEVISLS